MKPIAGLAVYLWAWYFYAPVRKHQIVHDHGRRTLRRTYVLNELHLNGGTLRIKKSMHVNDQIVCTAGTLHIGAGVDVGRLTLDAPPSKNRQMTTNVELG